MSVITCSIVVGVQPALAAAGPSPACSGVVCVDVAPLDSFADLGQSVPIDYQLNVFGGAAPTASFIVRPDAGLTPDPSSFAIDSVPVPAADVTVTAVAIEVNLASGVPLSEGFHDVGFSAIMSPTATRDQILRASVVFADTVEGPAVTVTSPDLTVHLNLPDFQISSATEPPTSMLAGGTAIAGLNIFGPPQAAAVLVLDVPAGFSIGPVTNALDGSAYACAPPLGGQIRCTGEFTYLNSVNIEVGADLTDRVGQSGALVATVAPVGLVDANPADNTATIPLTVTGSSALAVTISPGPQTTYVGRAYPYTITVTNQGPDPSVHTSANVGILADPGEFAISFPAAMHVLTNSTSSAPPFASWPIGTLATGQSVSITVTVRALKAPATTAILGVVMQSDSSNPLQCADRACLFAASVSLTASAASMTVKAPATTPTTRPTPPADPTAAPIVTAALPQTVPVLAATGGQVRLPLIVGLLALMVGALLQRVGRRRIG